MLVQTAIAPRWAHANQASRVLGTVVEMNQHEGALGNAAASQPARYPSNSRREFGIGPNLGLTAERLPCEEGLGEAAILPVT